MSELPLSKRARLTEEMSAQPPAAAASSPLLKSRHSYAQPAQPTFADVAYILGQSKVLQVRQLAKTALLLSKEVSACMFPDRSDLWVGICRDRFGSKMIAQLKEAKLLSEENDFGSPATVAGSGTELERLVQALAKGMCEERGWAPDDVEGAKCVANTSAPEVENFDGAIPPMKELGYERKDYWFVLQVFSEDGFDEAPLISHVVPASRPLPLGLKINDFFLSTYPRMTYKKKKFRIRFDEPIVLSCVGGTAGNVASKCNQKGYWYRFEEEGAGRVDFLGSLHTTVHIVRRNYEGELQGLCIHRSTPDSAIADEDMVFVKPIAGRHKDKKMGFFLPSVAISLEDEAKGCFDRMEMGVDGYIPNCGVSVSVELGCVARRTQLGSYDIVAQGFDIIPRLHSVDPSCGHSKCKACTKNCKENLDNFQSSNSVAFVDILEHAKGWGQVHTGR